MACKKGETYHKCFSLLGDMEVIMVQKTSKHYSTEFYLEEGF
jgi:hypothetical protein